ncbi:MAG: DUF1638 domain-containing protein [Geminicoccaceae bacterium]|nr:DUF1638 domain-containing protein [Geminicoccaceae bacterium]
MAPRTLVIACGALAREILAIRAQAGLETIELACLPAGLHNRPAEIPEAVRAEIRKARGRFERIFVAYADCGTGGMLDRVLDEEGVARIGGAHCYAFFAGQDAFARLAEAEPGTFYLTDFLARQFDALVWEGLGLDRHPELRDAYFGNYTRLVYLAQTDDPALTDRAKAAAARLGLAYLRIGTGMGELDGFLQGASKGFEDGGAAHRLLARHPGAGDRQGGAEGGPAPAAGAVRAGDRPRRDARQAHRNRRLPRRVA